MGRTVRSESEKGLIPFVIALFFFCILFSAQKIASFDIWWHLKTGEWIWHNKAIPYLDPFSYTFHHAEWIDFEWLFQALIYPLYQLGGFGGLIIFKIVVILLTFATLFLTCREVDRGKGWLSVTLLFFALEVARVRFLVRPQIIFLFFLALYLYLFTLHRGGKITTRKLILLLLPINVLWVNAHSSFLMGILLVGAYALGRFVPLVLSHHRDLKPVLHDRQLQGFLLLCFLLVITSFLNPHTYRVFLVPLKTLRAEEALMGIAEWVPVDIRILGLLVTDPSMWFRALFSVGVVSFLLRKDNLKRVEDLVIFAFFSYLAFKHIRFCGAFAIAAAPIVVNNLTKVRWQLNGWRWVRLLPLLLMIGFCIRDARELTSMGRLGLGVLRHYPEATVAFLKEHHVKGRIFNSYGLGGYLIWYVYPDIPVFIDGRTPTIYSQDFFWLYSMAERKKEVWQKVVERYGVEIVLVREDRERGYPSLCYWLDEDADWRVVAFDDTSTLYMRKGTAFDELIEQYGFRYLRPSDLQMDYAKEKKGEGRFLRSLEGELKEACRRFPGNFYPFYYLGLYHQIYGTKEHFEHAEKALRRAIVNRPKFPRGYYELGFTLVKLERYDEAAQALKKTLRLSPNPPNEAYYYLGASLYQRGEMDEAIRVLEKYRQNAGLGTRHEAYRFLGRAYVQRHEFRKALSCLEREGSLGEPTWETFANMGVAYFGLDALNKARGCFERAMEMKPDNLKVVYNLALVYEKLGLFENANRLFEKASQMRPQTREEEAWILRAREKIQ